MNAGRVTLRSFKKSSGIFMYKDVGPMGHDANCSWKKIICSIGIATVLQHRILIGPLLSQVFFLG